MNRQKLLLIILVGLLTLALVYAYRATPRQSPVSEAGSRRSAATQSEIAAKPSASAAEPRVQLELLVREDDASPGFRRNIFRFWQPAPAAPPLTPVAPPPPPAEEEVEEEEAAPRPETLQMELARFTFLGFLLKDGVKTVFLSSGDELFMVKKGDRFGKARRFFVTDLTPDRLTIRQNDDPRPITVPLVEQAPLAAYPSPALSPGLDSPRPEAPPRRRRPPPIDLTLDVLPPLDPAEPDEIPAGEAVPVEQPPAEEPTPPQDAPPSEDPND